MVYILLFACLVALLYTAYLLNSLSRRLDILSQRLAVPAHATPEDQGETASPKRSRLSFRLRTLIFMFLPVSIVMALVGYEVNRVKRQSAAVEAFTGIGATATYQIDVSDENALNFAVSTQDELPAIITRVTGPYFGTSVVMLEFGKPFAKFKHEAPFICYWSDPRFRSDELRHLQSLPNLRCLWLNYTATTDRDLAHLRHVKKLRYLSLANTEVTGKGLRHLAVLDSLEVLDLSAYGWDPDDLEPLHGLPSLRELCLSGANDSMLDKLQDLPHLNTLTIQGDEFSGEALAKLASLPSINTLELEVNSIKAEDLAELKKVTQLRTLRLEINSSVLSIDDGSSLHGLNEVHQLKSLSLVGIEFLEAKPLMGLTFLKQLSIRPKLTFSDQVLPQIKSALPNTEIDAGDDPPLQGGGGFF